MAYFPANVYGEYGGDGEKFPYIKKSGDTATGLIIFNGGIQTNVGEATFNGPIVANDEVTINNTGSLYVDGPTEFADDVNITGGTFSVSVPINLNEQVNVLDGIDMNASELSGLANMAGNPVFVDGFESLGQVKFKANATTEAFLFVPQSSGVNIIENENFDGVTVPDYSFYLRDNLGVRTYSAKIDYTGLHSRGNFDTLNEIAGNLTVGNAVGRTGNITIGGNTVSGSITIGPSTAASANSTINIGTGNGFTGPINIGNGSSSKTISIGNGGTITIQTSLNLNLNGIGLTRLGNAMTGGGIVIGRNDSVVNNTYIDLGCGSQSTGPINIGVSASAKAISIGNAANNGSIGIGCLTPSYTGTTPTSLNIGYKANLTVGSLVATLTSPANINTTAISVPNGVWLANIVLKIAYASQPSAPTYVRLSLSTVSATAQDERTIDFNPNTSGANFCNYAVTIANSTATNYWVVGSAGGSVTPTVTSLVFNITRMA
jgi:hypothetical protein